MLKNIIENKLQEEYNHYVSLYGRNQILGTFSIGRLNYDFAESEDDFHFVTVYIPTFDDLCFKQSFVKLDSHMGPLYDIRRAYNCVHNQEVPLELLFAKYSIITERYRWLFNEYFFSKREQLARINPYMRLEKAQMRMLECFRNDKREEGAHIALAALMYSQGRDCADCFSSNDDMSRMMLRNINTIDNNFFIETMAKALNSVEETCESDEIVREGIIAIITESLHHRVSIDSFVAELNENERVVFDWIASHVDSAKSITISIAQLTRETGVSKFHCNNLLQKMSQAKLAFVESHGAKGTTINLL